MKVLEEEVIFRRENSNFLDWKCQVQWGIYRS